MKPSIIQSTLLAAALLLSASFSRADEEEPETPAEPRAISGPKAKDAKPAARVKLVDINGAGKAELKTLPGIGDAEARKIIAGRPYLSKANLLTQNILSAEAYERISSRVMAKPNKASEAKLREMQKARQTR